MNFAPGTDKFAEILSFISSDSDENSRSDGNCDQIDLCWYPAWISRQLKNMPAAMANIRVGDDLISSSSALHRIFLAVRKYISQNEDVSIDEIVENVRATEQMQPSSDHPDAQRLLVFSILGWLSMLYQPAFNVCSFSELAIHHDKTQPDSGLVFDTYRVPADLADRPLYVLLKGFGNLLPARKDTLGCLASEKSAVASTWLPIYPNETNMHNLHTLLRVSVRWVDTLALHLDFDKSTRTLSLFSCPSICLSMLKHGGAIYSFASADISGIDPRGNREDITEYLQNVLLSYRLLFAQSAASRKFFRHHYRASEELCNQIDTLLPVLCTSKVLDLKSDLMPRDRPIYYVARDFPVLYERMELLITELNAARPKSMRDLLHDRRDTLQYWTFWLVSIFGCISIFLSFVQVVLQAVQTAYSLPSNTGKSSISN